MTSKKIGRAIFTFSVFLVQGAGHLLPVFDLVLYGHHEAIHHRTESNQEAEEVHVRGKVFVCLSVCSIFYGPPFFKILLTHEGSHREV